MYEKTYVFYNTVNVFEAGDVVKTRDTSRRKIAAGVYTVIRCDEPEGSDWPAMVFLRDAGGREVNERGHPIVEGSNYLELVTDVRGEKTE